MNQTVLLTTAFNVDKLIFEQFARSIKNQTKKKFDLMVVNDGFVNLTKHLESACPGLEIKELQGVGNIAQNREILLNAACENKYDYAVLADFDDYMRIDRVEKTVEGLVDAEIVYNDLVAVDSEGIPFNHNLIFGSEALQTITYEDIANKNFLGLSNTGLQLKELKNISFPSNLRVIDWYFFTDLLLQGKVAKRVETISYYRQHSHNIAGIRCHDRIAEISKEIEVKKAHYRAVLENLCPNEEIKNKLFSYLETLNGSPSKLKLNNLRSWWSLVNEEQDL